MKSVKAKIETTDTKESRKRILKTLGKKDRTANEVIDLIFLADVKSGKIEERSWKYYVHLNKLFKALSRGGYIFHSGFRVGPTGRQEKVWRQIL